MSVSVIKKKLFTTVDHNLFYVLCADCEQFYLLEAIFV